MPYVAVQDLITEANPHGRRNYWSADFLAELPDEAVDVLVEHATDAGVAVQLDAARRRRRRGRTGARRRDRVRERTAPFNTHYLSMWEDPADDERNIAYTRAIAAAMKPWTTGQAYLNYIGDEGLHRVESSFGEEKYARLQEIKAEVGPRQRVPPQPEHRARVARSVRDGIWGQAPYFWRRPALASMNAMRSLVGRRPSAP